MVPAPYSSVGSVEDLFPGTWFLTEVDNMHRRKYERKPMVNTSDVDMAEISQVRAFIFMKSISDKLQCTLRTFVNKK